MNKKALLTLIFLMFASSCGFLSDEKPEASISPASTCEINPDRLAKVLTENIDTEIQCLEQNLLSFSKLVKRDNQQFIEKEDLKKFIVKFFGATETLSSNIDLLFELNMLLLRDRESSISKDNIKPFFKLLIALNREAVILGKLVKDFLKEENNTSLYPKFRQEIIPPVKRISDAFVEVLSKKEGFNQQRNLIDFLEGLKARFPAFSFETNMVKEWLFLKPVFLGGAQHLITSDELLGIAKKLPTALITALDIIYTDKKNFTITDHSRSYSDLIRSLQFLLYQGPNSQDISVDGKILFQKVQGFLPEGGAFPLSTIKLVFENLKPRLFGGDKESYSLKEIQAIVNFANEGTELFYFNNLAYEVYRKYLDSPEKLTQLPLIIPESFEYFSQERRNQFLLNFNHITTTYRFYRDQETLFQNYDKTYRRNRSGINFYTIIGWGVQQLTKAYGHPSQTRYFGVTHVVKKEELKALLIDLKPIFEHFNFWPINLESFLGNTLVMGDLFQSQSNGDNLLNYHELTEYISLLLNAQALTTRIHKKIEDYCPNIGDEIDAAIYEAPCARNNLLRAFFDDQVTADSMPLLGESFFKLNKEEQKSFMKSVDGFGRSSACRVPETDNDLRPCTDDDPMPQSHTVSLFVTLLNIESTFLRFDTDNSQVIDKKELNDAFKVYKKVITDLSKLKGPTKFLAKPIFFYMVNKKSVPEFKDLLKYVTSRQKTNATRSNVASLLSNLAKVRAEGVKGIEEAEKEPGIMLKALNWINRLFGRDE